MTMPIVSIQIDFPEPVEMPPGFDQTLVALVDMICKSYEQAHPDRTMWPAGIGAKPRWNEPEEPEFDSSVFHIDVWERRASERELERRARRRAKADH